MIRYLCIWKFKEQKREKIINNKNNAEKKGTLDLFSLILHTYWYVDCWIQQHSFENIIYIKYITNSKNK